MNLISWNIRGLGGGCKQGTIKKIVREKKVAFLGLMETKCSAIRKSKVIRVWSDDEFQWAAVDAINTSGGLLCEISQENLNAVLRL